MNATDEVQNLRETPCPRCGEQAEASFAPHEKGRVEISCAACGRFEMTREEFDAIASEMVEADEQS